MPFQKGNKLSKGRPKKTKTQVKDFIKAYPYAVETLMQTLYKKGIKGDIEAAKYVVDRIQGKPKAQTDIKIDADQIGVGMITQIYKLMSDRQKLLEGGSQDGQQAEGASEVEEAETA